jgi:hypothetical protein
MLKPFVLAVAFSGVAVLTPAPAWPELRQTVTTEPHTATHLRLVDDALRRGDVSAAVRAWHDAHRAALGSRQWEPMLAVGDARLRVGAASGFVREARSAARQHYLAALFRARQRGAVDGVLRVAEAFAALGDREVVEGALRIAQELANRGAGIDDRQARRAARDGGGMLGR